MRTSVPPGWVPTSVIMEGMFMFLINITPWSAHKCMGDYDDFLLGLCHFRKGANEVHLLFDDPDCQMQSPKHFERQHRDQINKVPDDHHWHKFTTDILIALKWRENVLSCRTYKRNLVCSYHTNFLKNQTKASTTATLHYSWWF